MVNAIAANSYFNPYAYVKTNSLTNSTYNQSSFFPTSFSSSFPSSYPSSSFNAPSLSSLYTSTSTSYSKNQSNALVGLTSKAIELQTSAKTLDASSPSSVLYQRSVTSSASDSVTGTAANGAKRTTYIVNVSQIAEAQQNSGAALDSSAVTSLATGNQSFSVDVAGKLKTLSFSVSAGDTNQAVMTKMSQSINNANIGITASINKNTVAGTSQLLINAKNTGVVNTFSLADLSGAAVAVTGANTKSNVAENAAYSVNGIAHTSSSNNINLNDPKVTINLLKPVTGAKLTVGNDVTAITKAVTDFTSTYNKTLTFLSDNQSYLSPQLANSLKQAYTQNEHTLQKAGITKNTDGTLKVDAIKLANSLENDSVNLTSSLSGSFGLAKVSNTIGMQISNSPTSTYAKSPSYTIPNALNFSNQNSFYWQSIGNLFNQTY